MTSLPEGFVAHSGGPCPVALDSKPGILLADGTMFAHGQIEAGYWVDARWTGKRGPYQRGKLPTRIIAYKVENP